MSNTQYTEEEPAGTITGVRVAIVTDNEDPEELGRVALSYPWRDADDESDWARIATGMTGESYGTYFLPEVGDEVLVAFENGDIHNPVVVGSLWSGNRKPPETNSDGKNEIRTITTRSGHRIAFADDEGEADGTVRIETTGGHTIELDDGGDSVTIEDAGGNSIELDAAGGDISLSASGTISLDANEITLSATQSMKLDSKGQVEVSGAQQAKLASKGTLNVESQGPMDVSTNAMLNLGGSMIFLN